MTDAGLDWLELLDASVGVSSIDVVLEGDEVVNGVVTAIDDVEIDTPLVALVIPADSVADRVEDNVEIDTPVEVFIELAKGAELGATPILSALIISAAYTMMSVIYSIRKRKVILPFPQQHIRLLGDELLERLGKYQHPPLSDSVFHKPVNADPRLLLALEVTLHMYRLDGIPYGYHLQSPA